MKIQLHHGVPVVDMCSHIRSSLFKAVSAVARTDDRNSVETEEIPHKFNEGKDLMQRIIG
ncbi:hypothetical protein SESBI_03591 [Sesbania bispinosa]|nr:hypothetical protein SESBI_03591 [Sesbania bispinosa]